MSAKLNLLSWIPGVVQLLFVHISSLAQTLTKLISIQRGNCKGKWILDTKKAWDIFVDTDGV